MPLAPGTRLGPYEITGSLGAGGMGEVYRARDTALGREVALKTLPEGTAASSEKLSRFRREARLLASLNHPNVATLHGVETADGQELLVMELVEGETLADRTSQGPIPLDEAIPIFRQIADGLHAAHEKGVVHRDLKPSNVMLTPEDEAKVLDFGLAKGTVSEGVSEDSPTVTRQGTESGVILGTAAYMSPEQARGRSVDKRTDVWSFGVCLYEALAGVPAFRRETISDTMAAILTSEPDWSALPASTPAGIRRLLLRCLRKDRKERLHDLADARIELVEAALEPLSLASATREYRGLNLIPWAATLLLAAALMWHWRSHSSRPPETERYQVSLRPASKLGIPRTLAAQLGGQEFALSRAAFDLSPDGGKLVFVGTDGDTSRLYLRHKNDEAAQELPGTEGAIGPFFAPDGEWIGFWSEGSLEKVSIRAETRPSELCDTPLPLGASWSRTGQIVYSDGPRLLRVSADGGIPEVLITIEAARGEEAFTQPHFLPDGNTLLFTVKRGANWERARVELYTLGSGDRRVVLEEAADARYASSGHLVYMRGGTLTARAFDLGNLEPKGGEVGILPGVGQAVERTMADTGAAQLSLSESGTLVYVSRSLTRDLMHSLVWVDRDGTESPIGLSPRRLWFPRIAPDGQRLLFNVRTAGNDDLWLFDLPDGPLTRLTYEDSAEDQPIWTPDGNGVTFFSNRSGTAEIYTMPSGVDAPAKLISNVELPAFPGSWSPDGSVLAFLVFRGSADIWTLSTEDGTARPFVETEFQEQFPVFSPDGRWLAYASDESGQYEVYVRPYPGPGARLPVSTSGGAAPVWTKGGRELIYRTENADGMRDMMAVAVAVEEAGGGLRFGRAQAVFPDIYHGSGPVRSYDVTPDGERFLMVRNHAPAFPEITELDVVLLVARAREARTCGGLTSRLGQRA